MKNCYGIDFRSWRKELRTEVDAIAIFHNKKILFSFFSVCLPLFIRHIAAMLLRKTSSKTMQTVTKYLKELSGVRSDNSPNSYK